MNTFMDQFGNEGILIRATQIGDLNLDGCTTIADFIDLASSLNGQGLWQNGDLNGDGLITIADFIDLASNLGACYDGSAAAITPAELEMLNAFAEANGVTAVPEPSVLSLLLLLVPACSRGRFKRQRKTYRLSTNPTFFPTATS